MTLEKWFDGILLVWTVLSLFWYSPAAYLKTRYPRFFRHLDRFVTYLWLAIAPIAAYELFLSFRSAKPASRLVFAFLAFVALVGLAARWWDARNKSAPSQS
ncbi:MAG: hypothetical protein ACXVKH_17705 [Candidatus Angelobacter sp.]